MRLYPGIRERPWWKQSVNATGYLRSHPLQMLVSAFRVVAYGESTDRSDEYVCFSSSTVESALKKLVEYRVSEFGAVILRPPNGAELDIILKPNTERGIPGCIGTLDCSWWEGRNCPTGRAGIYQNLKYKRSVVIETVCDEDLYIWYLFVGFPGSMNDLNVMLQSPLYHDVTVGNGPPRGKPFTINNTTRTLLYYLVDGM